MEGLDSFLGADDDAQAVQDADPGEGKAKDVKPAEQAKPATAPPASSAGQATDKPDGSAKPAGDKPTEEQAAAEARARDENGRFTKTDAADEATGLRTALQQERQKRQQAEAKLAQGAQPPAPKKNFFDDPEAALDERDQRIQFDNDKRFFALCERGAKERHADFSETVDALLVDCDADDSLRQTVQAYMRGSDDWAEALYKYASNRRELSAVGGDLGKYRSSVEQPLRDRIKELEGQLAAKSTELENLSKLPRSLNLKGSAKPGGEDPTADDREESLTDILEPRQKRRA